MKRTIAASPLFGEQQLRLMRELWRKPRSARELTDALNAQAGSAPMAHSTVQTLLRQLESKGAVCHVQDGRTFIFQPLVEQGRTVAQATRDLISRLFGGSAQELVAHLLESEQISPQELARIDQLIAARRTEASK